MFLKSSLLMTSGLGFDTYVREEVREERVQVKKPHVILIMTDQASWRCSRLYGKFRCHISES